jgi:hypothetical protein
MMDESSRHGAAEDSMSLQDPYARKRLGYFLEAAGWTMVPGLGIYVLLIHIQWLEGDPYDENWGLLRDNLWALLYYPALIILPLAALARWPLPVPSGGTSTERYPGPENRPNARIALPPAWIFFWQYFYAVMIGAAAGTTIASCGFVDGCHWGIWIPGLIDISIPMMLPIVLMGLRRGLSRVWQDSRWARR